MTDRDIKPEKRGLPPVRIDEIKLDLLPDEVWEERFDYIHDEGRRRWGGRLWDHED